MGGSQQLREVVVTAQDVKWSYDRALAMGGFPQFQMKAGSLEDPAQFKYLYAYSPYHHVTRGTRYPPLLMMSADHDDRVDPMHARKFAAAMQAASAGGPVLLRVEKTLAWARLQATRPRSG